MNGLKPDMLYSYHISVFYGDDNAQGPISGDYYRTSKRGIVIISFIYQNLFSTKILNMSEQLNPILIY